ncbi:hypothetical protein CRG98_037818 [Punica granatum]|uniref:Retrotransposon gag domain-containing protein n=1 Tax=Punica granatum TaxID=22663 RepID=A0A2I0IDA0_PUNGR|nr:hypothetical protein CRG98_037818 [Punica granatum]
MPIGTRNQGISKLTAALEEQDKAMVELKTHTSSRIDQLAEMIGGLTLQQNKLMAQLQSGYEDPIADLKNFKQGGSVQDYMTEFDALLNKVSVTETDALSHFLGGLRTEIQLPIRMFHPTSLSQAYSLAKLQESTLLPSINLALLFQNYATSS